MWKIFADFEENSGFLGNKRKRRQGILKSLFPNSFRI